jgi:hypothetical protein
MNKFAEYIAYFNPLFFYYTAIYCVTKIIEPLYGCENVWETIWNKIMDTFGDGKDFYIVWGLTTLSAAIYWIFGALFMMMDALKRPKQLENFKIQPNKSEIEKPEKLLNVSY